MADLDMEQQEAVVGGGMMAASAVSGAGGLAGEAGGGEEDMVQDFVRLHMVSILQPFAERVHELQGQVEQLAGGLASVHGLAEGHGVRLEQAEHQLSALEGASAQAGEQLEGARAELASLKREKSRLEGNHEMTKASVGKTKEILTQLGASVEALQKALEASSGRIGTLESGLPEVEKRVSGNIDARLDRQGRVCKELNDRQAEMQKTCQQAKAQAESASTAFKELLSSNGQRLQEDLTSLTSLGERAAHLEARFQEVDRQLERHGEAFKATDKEIAHLRTWSGQLADLRRVQAQQSEELGPLAQQGSRLDMVEAEIAQMRSDVASDRQSQCTELSSLEQRVHKNIADIVKWRDNQEGHCDVMSTASKRLEDLERGQGTLAGRVDTTEQEVNGLTLWRQGAAEKLGSHGQLLEVVHAAVQQAQERIQDHSAGLQGMHGEAKADRDVLAKLSSRVEMCCTYFNGLGKGLQDTHRQIVSGESGLLPPKTGGMMLPAIPRGPRTPRTSVSPRKALP